MASGRLMERRNPRLFINFLRGLFDGYLLNSSDSEE